MFHLLGIPLKRNTGKVVPTWNYAVVHAYGALRIIDDRVWLREFVEQLTSRHEAERRQSWKVSDAPADFIEQQLAAIIGFEMPITRLQGKWKLSQNRPLADSAGVVEGLLEQGGDNAVATADLVRRSRTS